MLESVNQNITDIVTLFQANANNLIKSLTNVFTTANANVDQAKRLASYVVPINSVVVGQTSVQFDSSGQTLQNGDTLPYPQSEHFLCFGIRILSGAAATLNGTAWTPGVSAADLQAGSLTILNNGDTVLKNMPLSTFSLSTNIADTKAGIFNLAVPILIRAQTNFTIQYRFPVAPATANQNLRIEFIGYKFI